jgi:hypothetical protein
MQMQNALPEECSVLCDCSLASTGVRRNEHALSSFDAADGLLLKRVELERVPVPRVKKR